MYQRAVTLESLECTGKWTFTARYSLMWRGEPLIKTMTLHMDHMAAVISVDQHD